jgi:hypothetical protein
MTELGSESCCDIGLKSNSQVAQQVVGSNSTVI